MERPWEEEEIVEDLKAFLKGDLLDAKIPRRRRIFVDVRTPRLKQAIAFLKDKMEFTHLSTITGIDVGNRIEALYHLCRRGALELSLRVEVPMERPTLPTITDVIPGASLYEREVHDLLGVVFEGHPDLSPLLLPEGWKEGVYPLRKEWSLEGLRKEIFGGMEGRREAEEPLRGGKEGGRLNIIEIPFGPQHPALKEPENFMFEVDGELVVDVKPRIGYNHRGIEKAMELRTYIQNLYLVERVCGICSDAHTTCYVQVIEELLGVEAPPRARYIRVIVAELERIHSHSLWLGLVAHEIGFDTLFMYVWRDREIVMDLLEMISGNRVHYAMNTIGGVRRDIPPEKADRIRKQLDILEERTRYYRKVVLTEPTVLRRTVGVGVLKPVDAVALCTVGPTLRASGVKRDVRADDPYAAYDEIPFNVVTYSGCDVHSRILTRIDEILESIQIIRYALDHLPTGRTRIRVPSAVPEGEVVSRVEAPRGELIHYARSNGTIRPERYKIRSPTLGNILGLCKMLLGGYIADIPVVVAGIDPCFACMDRMAFVDVSKRKKWVWSGEELRRYALKWYGGKAGR